MTELKTLKDFMPFNPKECNGIKNLIQKEKLRQSAIEDIKELDKIHLRMIYFGKTKIIKNEIAKQIQNYIKWKNNLTEEDLK